MSEVAKLKERSKRKDAIINELRKSLESLNAIVYSLSLPHGACEPIERKACTHCAALRRLKELAAQHPVTITTAKSIACRPQSSEEPT